MDRRVIRVVVASPGDVARERDIAARVLEENNRGIGRDKNLLCEVWRWETDTYPQFHPDGPQGVIDRALRIADCDLLIGIFWKRFGTPVKDAASGTEHEIRLAHQAWKDKQRPQIMLYFNEMSYSPGSEDELDQWKSVFAFKNSFKREGLLQIYRGPQKFETLLRQHINAFLINYDKTPELPALPPGPAQGNGHTGATEEQSPSDPILEDLPGPLSSEERTLLARMSVFQGKEKEGDFSFVACAEVNSDFRTRDVRLRLDQLLERCVLRRPEANARRYELAANLRPALAKLLEHSGAGREARTDHARFFRDFVEVHEGRLMGPERRESLRAIEADLPNIKGAIEWCLQQPKLHEDALRIAGAMFWFWNMSARFREGRACLWKVLEGTRSTAPRTEARVRALAKASYALGGLAFLEGSGGTAIASLEESVQLWRTLPAGDDRNRWLAYALIILGRAKHFNEGQRHEEEAVQLLGAVNDPWGHALALNDLGYVLASQDKLGQAEKAYESSLSHWTNLNDPWGLPLTLNNLGWLKVRQNMLEDARDVHDRALRYHIGEGDHWGAAESLRYLAELACKAGRLEEADQCYRESLSMHRIVGRKRLIYDCLVGLATLATTRLPLSGDRAVHAAQLLAAADRCAHNLDFVFTNEQREFISKIKRTLKSYLGAVPYNEARENGSNMILDNFVNVTLW